MIYRPSFCFRRRKAHLALLLASLFALSWPAAVLATDNILQHTQNNPDKSLRREAHVDPATHGMSIEIPLGVLPGRAGLNLPVSITYSSKVWRIGDVNDADWSNNLVSIPPGGTVPVTTIAPKFGEYSAAGWTSSLNPPRIEYTFGDNYSDYDGQAGGVDDLRYRIARIHVHMPDGSTHELRKGDAPFSAYDYEYPTNGTYYAVDSSQLRYDINSKTLFLPDGSRYVFAEVYTSEFESPVDYIDRNGNKISYNKDTRKWTDTLGREIDMPLPSTALKDPVLSSGIKTYTLPGANDALLTYKFYWSRLGDLGLELWYKGNHDCGAFDRIGTLSPALFSYTNFPQGLMCAGSGRFNPIVLSRIDLPNGTSYKFTYNVYGEITKITFPTGGHERFQYDYMTPMTYMKPPYNKGNRGVTDRWVSADGTTEAHWQYGVEYAADSFNPYITTMTAPDGTVSKNILWAQPRKFDNKPFLSIPYNYSDARNGRVAEAYIFKDGVMLRRTLTEWTVDFGAQITTQYGTTPFYTTRNPRVTKQVEIVLDTDSTTALAATTTMQYDNDLNLISTSKYDYAQVDYSTALTGQIGQISQGALVSRSEATYLVNDNSIPVNTRQAYRDRNLIALPTSTRIIDQDGTTIIARTLMSYDESPLLAYGTVKGWVNPGATTARGNLTKTQNWLRYPGATDSYLTVSMKYDECGNIVETTDARQNKSTITYSAVFDLYTYPQSMTSPDPDGAGPAQPLITTSAYDVRQQGGKEIGTGLLLSMTDANNQTTTYSYDDLNRPKTITRPTGGGATTYVYHEDTVDSDGVNDTHIITQTSLDDSRVIESIQYFDGLGRPSRALLKENAASESGKYTVTDTKYDSMGRVWRVSNPYRLASPGPVVPVSGKWTTTTYDDLGRVIAVEMPKEAGQTESAKVTTGYSGNRVMVTDQALNKRLSISNALGQLKEVWEIRTPDTPTGTEPVTFPGPAGTGVTAGYRTKYSYDMLGNLTQVTQRVGANGVLQTRTFIYDSLSRLRSAENPESGLIRYEYDASGNLKKRTDARGVVTNYSYDALNRITTRSYTGSTPATPNVTYRYDEAGVSNSKGRLTSVSSSVSTYTYDEYDAMGRVTRSRQQTPGLPQPYPQMEYGYDLAGNLTRQKYPSGKIIVTEYDSAGRAAGIKDQAATTYYAGAAPTNTGNRLQYAAHGAMEKMRLGNGLWERTLFNTRLQPSEIGLSASPTNFTDTLNYLKWKVNYSYVTSASSGRDNNGNLRSQMISAPGFAAPLVQSYQYDQLNRISSAQETQNGLVKWTQAFSYDRFGNRRIVAASTTSSLCGVNPSISSTNNRINTSGYDYDEAGNLTRTPVTNTTSHAYGYDGENRMVTYDGGVASYSYDGDGRRVKTQVGSGSLRVTTLYVYNAFGQMVAEYNNSGQGVDGGRQYLTQDHLGSTRVITKADKSVKARSDYLPFGEEIGTNFSGRGSVQGYNNTSVTKQKFTGKERDVETGLDYFLARYYSPAQGRFTSVDPENAGADESDPQSWNGYTYARNNPLLLTDPDGREFQICYANGDCHTYTDEQFKQIKADATNLGSVFKNGKIYNEVDGKLIATGNYTRTDTSGMWDDVAPQLSSRLEPVLKVAKVEAAIILTFSLPAGGGSTKLTSLGALGRATESALGITTKAAAREAIERMAVSEAAKATARRSVSHATTKSTIDVVKEGSNLTVRISRPGRDGYQVIESIIKSDGTKATVQKAFDAAGRLVHYHPK